MKKRILTFIVLLCLLITAACGTQQQPATTTAAAATTAAATTAAAAATRPELAYDGNYGNADTAYNIDLDKYDGGGEAHAESQQERKEIKNVNCTLTVKDVVATYNSIYDILVSLGGYEFNKTESKREGVVYYSLTLKLPPENLPEFERQLRAAAGDNAVSYYNVSSQDITSAYYDTSARLDSMKASIAQYYAMLSRANTVAEMLEIRREITYLQADIDSLQGQLNVWNALVSYATIEMQIQREDDPLAQTRTRQWSFNSPSEIFNSIGNGFIATGNVVYQIIVGIFVVLISLLPALIPIGAIVILVVFIRRRTKEKKRMQIENLTARIDSIGGISSAAGENDEPETPAEAAVDDAGAGNGEDDDSK